MKKPKDKGDSTESGKLTEEFCKACKEVVLDPHDCPSSGEVAAVHMKRHMELGL